MTQYQDAQAESSIAPRSRMNIPKAITPDCFVLLLLVVGLALMGCDGKPRAAKKPPTPEQVEASQCFKRLAEKSIQTDKELLDRELELIASRESTVSITLSRRRAEEERCAEEAQCFNLKEPEYSLYFASCLRGDDKQ